MLPAALSYRDVAAALRVSDSTVRRLCRRGELPRSYVGGAVRIDAAAVWDYLARHRQGARTVAPPVTEYVPSGPAAADGAWLTPEEVGRRMAAAMAGRKGTV